MGRTVAIFAAAVLAGLLAVPQASAEPLPTVAARGDATDWSGQRKVRRAGTRLRVVPGRLIKRECKAWYVEERRPSGPVVTPRMQCWWVRG